MKKELLRTLAYVLLLGPSCRLAHHNGIENIQDKEVGSVRWL